MEESNERTTLLENGDCLTSSSTSSITEIRFKVYKRRWYVLFVFTANAYVYNMAWNTWAPIQEPTKLAFGWTDFDILLLSSWAAISLIVTSVPLTWLMDSKGQFLIMAGGPVSIGGPPLVSATWFPPGERTTATAIATLAGYFGIAQSFAIGPAMVPNQFVPSNASNSSSSDCPERLTRLADYQLTKYMYFELGLCALVFFCVLLYFPARPPLPPSLTSSTSQRLSTKSSFRNLTRNRPFWLLATLTGLTFGIYFGWLSMLDVFLAKFGVDDITAGWLGCSATLAGVFSGIALARFADYIRHRTKQILAVLLILSTLSQLIFSLSCAGILPSTKPLLYSSIIFGGFVYNGTLPLYFELAMECIYPVGEGIAGGIIITTGNVVLLLFYVAFMMPQSDVRWMNWVTVSGLGVCFLGLLSYRERYSRLQLDILDNIPSQRNLSESVG
ncbi:disrupted in renal carcinoma protein 2 homolog isoform X2 [Pocillopora damicornis]|uniref:disrupted in renal carcinoma protein 2 homolog isoform X2 n=1 Tax=Pocillopora damicornis TaxID=46731 RepID=UPI000F5597A3|nr:disrupted in renal carcinoma protein 2 homolog isoform X2 [Pocillopora damicornis]